MPHKTGFRTLIVAAAFASLTLLSCSKTDIPETASVDSQPMTEQAKEAMQDYARRPINKARMAQDLGDQRTEAMDAAINATVGK
ncbi:MAG: hypothetical protein AB9873_11730 [Syntrophobacteraceae bacterium]